MSIFGSYANGGAASAQSAGGAAGAQASSIFGAAGGSSTGGKEEAMSGGGGVSNSRGGGTFGSTEKSAPLAAPARGNAPRAAAPQVPERSQREIAMEEATRVPRQADMNAMAPKKTGDAKDIKELLAQLQQASVTNAAEEFQGMSIEIDREVPSHAVDDLRGMTTMLVKLDSPKADHIFEKPSAGKGIKKRLSAMDVSDLPNPDNDKNREDTLRETMVHIVKSNTRESNHTDSMK